MQQTVVFCPRCGRQRGTDHNFCAGCGRQYEDAVFSPHAPEGSGGVRWDERAFASSPGGRGPAETVARGLTVGLLLGIIVIGAMIVLAGRNLAIPGALSVLPHPQPPYQTTTLNVRPGQFATVTIGDVHAGQTLEGYFIAHGGNDDVGFQIQTPTGRHLVNIGRVAGRYDFHYQAPVDGPYVLVFGNTFSIVTSKSVTVAYRAY